MKNSAAILLVYTLLPGSIAAAQDWVTEAKSRIARHRMADMVITMTDKNGKPVSGVKVNVKLKKHAFTWAANIQQRLYRQHSAKARKYRKIIEDLGFNGVTQTTYWNIRWSNENQKKSIEDLNQRFHDAGFRVRCHPVLYPRWRTIPANVKAMRIEDARRAVKNHVREFASRMSGKFTDWDVVNESLINEDWIAGMGGEDALHEWFQIVRKEAPAVKTYLNETGIIYSNNNDRLDRFITRLEGLKKKKLIDGIGVQGHFNKGNDKPEVIYEKLERLAELDLPIKVTEMDLNTTDLKAHAEQFRDYLTILFSHRAVVGITLWGFWNGHMWNDRPGLYTTGFDLTPTGQVWMDLVQGEWKTDVTDTTGADGKLALRGFLGGYEITVHSDSGTAAGNVSLQASGLDLTMNSVDGTIVSATDTD